MSEKFTVLNLIRHHWGVSKNDLAVIAGLSKRTVGSITDEPPSEDFIHEVRLGESVGGKASRSFEAEFRQGLRDRA